MSSQIVSSDITFSKGWQHAGTADVTPAHSLVLDLTPGGDSDPSVLGWGSSDCIAMFLDMLLQEYEW